MALHTPDGPGCGAPAASQGLNRDPEAVLSSRPLARTAFSFQVLEQGLLASFSGLPFQEDRRLVLVNRICNTRDEEGDVMRETLPGAGGAHLVGIVDLAYPTDEGRREIVEYTTGRRRREVL